ncbi:hypothetical protein EI171_11425 [Bradyrhizobium sp. LCT2]|uniref:hypothetical protein n=1 Tax=Bradyrhizobium sp. LCT2 TaxID=2493093 RepID=UPI001373B1E9|nr:hypothetical protein [Bradyrhizobium sp. LCT2]QHP67917.1 hypothetical protein EI171_11425 [Bradyrhizobium sp. LCT2]
MTDPARGGCEIGGRDGRMARGAAEPKNGRDARNRHRGAVIKNRLSISENVPSLNDCLLPHIDLLKS